MDYGDASSVPNHLSVRWWLGYMTGYLLKDEVLHGVCAGVFTACKGVEPLLYVPW